MFEANFTTINTKLSKLHSNVAAVVKNLEVKLCEHHKSFTNTLANHPIQMSTNPVLTTIPEESVAHIAMTLAAEQKEKEKRGLNLIIHNVEESNAVDGATRSEYDISKCSDIFQTYLGVSATINKAFRLGKKSSKARLLKISLSNIQHKSTILKNKLKLRSSSNPSHIRKIFITPDLTPSEQKQSKELRQKLAKEREPLYFKKRQDSAEGTLNSPCTDNNVTPLIDSRNANISDSHDHSLVTLSLNCQSLVGKRESFWNLIDIHKPSIIFGQESWLKPSISSSEVFPSEYIAYHHNRADGYGGVFIACHNSLTLYELDTSTASCELVSCQIKLINNSSLIVISIYHPPPSNDYYLDNLCNQLNGIVSSHPNSMIWIAGDVNLPGLIIVSEAMSVLSTLPIFS